MKNRKIKQAKQQTNIVSLGIQDFQKLFQRNDLKLTANQRE